jgi:lysyl-tRNA synthetase class 2
MNLEKNNIEKNEYCDESIVRINKVKKLYEKEGLSAWPNPSKKINLKAKNIKSIPTTEYENIYTASGRIIGKREHGKTIFITIEDNTGTIQGYSKSDKEKTTENNVFNKIIEYFDLGDYISLTGTLFITKTGEITIRISDTDLLSKCIKPIPDSHVGFSDIEQRYRQRYLDMLVHKDIKELFIKRSIIIRKIRSFLDDNGYLEVETPMLHPIPGGANAKPFITHHNALDSDFYLRIAPELYLKRLVVGGFEKVYEINRNFRNEGVSIRHNPEFTMIEFYTAHKNYTWAMEFTEQIIKESAFAANNTYKVNLNGFEIDFEKPFEKINPIEAVIKYGNFLKDEISKNNIDNLLKKNKLYEENLSYYQKIFLLFEEFVEKKLINPTFLIDFPIEISPLAKRDPKNPKIASRFELFINGMEISNGFNELNDPFDQAERFKEQVNAKDSGDEEAMHFDSDYINALEYGLPPTVGVGIGIDRLVMLITGAKSIKDVILFPAMKRK